MKTKRKRASEVLTSANSAVLTYHAAIFGRLAARNLGAFSKFERQPAALVFRSISIPIRRGWCECVRPLGGAFDDERLAREIADATGLRLDAPLIQKSEP